MEFSRDLLLYLQFSVSLPHTDSSPPPCAFILLSPRQLFSARSLETFSSLSSIGSHCQDFICASQGDFREEGAYDSHRTPTSMAQRGYWKGKVCDPQSAASNLCVSATPRFQEVKTSTASGTKAGDLQLEASRWWPWTLKGKQDPAPELLEIVVRIS